MRIIVDSRVKRDFPDLKILAAIIKDLEVTYENSQLEILKENVICKVKSKYNAETLKSVPTMRAYRNFFWRLGIDPTKNRPAAEALIRRILLGNPLPKINTFVDSLNLASIVSEIAIASFDIDKIVGGSVIIRYANKGEKFCGIGMKKPLLLDGGEIVISDEAGLIAIYPYRDCERTKIMENTHSALLIFCGVPGINLEALQKAMNTALNLIIRFCGGSSILMEVE